MGSNEETNAAGTDTRPPMLVESDYDSYRDLSLRLRESSDFSEESVEKSWGKESANESGSEFIPCSIVPSLSSSNHVFASQVRDRGNIIRRTASFAIQNSDCRNFGRVSDAPHGQQSTWVHHPLGLRNRFSEYKKVE
ncbi:hypothetical protein Tco_0723782 [Tanacetum coccineum]